MNAERRHSRPEKTYTSSTTPSSKKKSLNNGSDKPLYDQYGEPLGRKEWKPTKTRKDWGA